MYIIPFAKVGARRLLIVWLPLVAWMGAIFVGSSLSAGAVGRSPLPVDEYPVTLAIDHVVEFALMAMLLYRAVWAFRRPAFPWLWTAVLVLTIGFGASDEFHQSFVPGRVPSLVDFGFDALGAVLGLVLSEAAVRVWTLVRHGARASRQIDARAEQRL